MIGQQLAYSQQLLTERIDHLTIELVNNYLQSNQGYIIEMKGEQVYINIGKQDDLVSGDRFKVLKMTKLIKDPVTRIKLGEIETKIAELELKEVNQQFSIAKIIRQTSYPKIGNKVVNQKKRIGVVNFSDSNLISGFTKLVQERMIATLKQQDKLIVISQKKIEQICDELDLSKQLGKEDLQLIGKKLNLDLLMVGDILFDEYEILINEQLYKVDLGNTIQQKAITVDRANKLIRYYQKQAKKNQPRFELLTKGKQLNYQALDIELGNVNQNSQLEVIVNTDQKLNILSYQGQELLEETRITDYYRTKYDDYKLLVEDIVGDQTAEIVVENYNQLINFKWQADNYLVNKLVDFRQQRPKAVASLFDKQYLVTRNNNHQLQFNIVKQNGYKEDFKLQLESNEGYRIAIGDLDQDSQQELIVTSYQGDNQYKIKLYTLEGELETVLPGRYGAAVAITDIELDGQKELLVYTTEEGNNRVMAYTWQQNQFKKKWESKSFSWSIRDLALGNINRQEGDELFVLLTKDKNSRIDIYKVNPYFKELNSSGS